MNLRFNLVVAMLASMCGTALGQAVLSAPTEQWAVPVPRSDYGNSVTMSPDGNLAISTGADGSVTALNSADGTIAWQFRPTITDRAIFSNSGITISSTGTYFIVGISLGIQQVDPNQCIVYAINFAGEMLWQSAELDGQCSGTPVLGSNDVFVYVNHNVAVGGRFSILNGADGTTFYNFIDPEQPYSPPGIVLSPNEGYYDGGQFNRNDLVVWAYTPRIDEGGVGLDRSFAFQLPLGFVPGASTNDTLAITTLNGATNWQSVSAPKFANFGYNMYWSVSRSLFRAWLGNPNDPRNAFDRVSSVNQGFDRGVPQWQAPFASPALSSDTVAPNVYGGTAGNLFVGFDAGLQEMWRFGTDFPIMAEARVSPDDSTVFFTEQDSTFHALNAATGAPIFSVRLSSAFTTANFALTASGRSIIFTDEAGIAYSYQVADVMTVAPTDAPVAPPTDAPVVPPTEAPIVPPTDAPVVPPTEAPVVPPTDAPIAPPTDAPVSLLADLNLLEVATTVPNPPLSVLTSLVTETPEAFDLLNSSSTSATVFAPTDIAFGIFASSAPYLGRAYLDDLLTPLYARHRLCVLKSHVIDQMVRSADFGNQPPIATFMPSFAVTLSADPAPSVNSIPVTEADLVAQNGIIHVINNNVLRPPCVGLSIYEQALATSEFSMIASITESLGLAPALTETRPLTVFAPTNDAFNALPEVTQTFLVNNTDVLAQIVRYHVVPSELLLLSNTTGAGSYATLGANAPNLTVTTDGGNIAVDGVAIDSSVRNVLAQNGVIHGIGSVLIPPGLVLPGVEPAPTESPTPSPTATPVTAAPVPMATATPSPAPANATAAPAPTSAASSCLRMFGTVMAVVAFSLSSLLL